MSVLYHTLLRQIAHRSGMLRGDAVFGVETSYLATPLTVAELQPEGAYPLQAMKDALLQAEEDFALAIATTGNHPMRSYLAGGGTSALAHQDLLPSLSSTNKQIIGSWGAVYDSADNNPLVEMPLDLILRRVRNANAHYVTPVYYYKIDGRRIYHTRTEVIIEVCVYDRADQSTDIDANNPMMLPDVLEGGLVARALSYLPKLETAGKYREYSDVVVMAIKAGIASIPSKSIPVPITESRAA